MQHEEARCMGYRFVDGLLDEIYSAYARGAPRFRYGMRPFPIFSRFLAIMLLRYRLFPVHGFACLAFATMAQAGPPFVTDDPEPVEFKHWEINRWYSTKNEDFGGMTPRDYLRGKTWQERYRIGLEKLKDFGVLK